MKRTVISILLAIVCSMMVQAKDIKVIVSENLKCNDSILVFSPAGMEAAREIPTLFLLHGYGGDYANWARRCDLQNICDRSGFRIVCPDGFIGSWYVDCKDKSRMQWRTFFWEELWPLIEKDYGLTPAKTFISGLSMGGYGATNIYFDHPERFLAAGSMSGTLQGERSQKSICKALGVEGIEDPYFREQNPLERLKGAKDKGYCFVITSGTEDGGCYTSSVEFAQLCRELKVKHVSMFSPGVHNWKFWVFTIEYHIDWFTKMMRSEL